MAFVDLSKVIRALAWIDLTFSFSALMDCTFVLPVVQCPNAIASYILFSFMTIYKKRTSLVEFSLYNHLDLVMGSIHISRSVLSKRTLCNDGKVLHPCYPIKELLATHGYQPLKMWLVTLKNWTFKYYLNLNNHTRVVAIILDNAVLSNRDKST